MLVQTERDFELVVVDDGSTDSSPAILAALAARDERIRILTKANGGISSALNLGIEAARGPLIARMDADDEMLPERLAVQAAYLRANESLGFCASFMDVIDGAGRMLSRYAPPPVDLDELETLYARKAAVTYTHPTVMYRTSLVRALGGYDRRFEPCEDAELFGRMLARDRPGLVIPRVLMRYRRHEGSISVSKARRQIEMLDLVRHNFYARRSGQPEVAPEDGQQRVRRMPLAKLIGYRARVASQTLRQIAAYDQSAGRRVRGGLRILAAAFLQPHRAAGQAVRASVRRALGDAR